MKGWMDNARGERIWTPPAGRGLPAGALDGDVERAICYCLAGHQMFLAQLEDLNPPYAWRVIDVTRWQELPVIFVMKARFVFNGK
ncbi:MAG: hypothetical protein ACRYGK_12510 [Janthinobacterium lividum]